MGDGLQIDRRFTKAGDDPFGAVEWSRRNSKIANPDGSVVFEMKDAEIPTGWSQVAADIMVSKYFRKAGVPQLDDDGNEILDEDGTVVTGSERSAKQVIGRLASTWRWWGERHGYFASGDDAQAFEDELIHMLVTQMAAPNSPQWFNTGLNHAYGLTGPAQGFWYVDPDTEELLPSPDSYTRPAPHACFPAGARIATEHGWRPIEKVQPGDRALTHAGRYRPVIDVMQRQVEEPLVRIAVTKLRAHDLVATENHPVLAVRRNAVRTARREGRLEALQAEWIPAGSIEQGDYVVVLGESPEERLPETVDLAEELGPNFEVEDVVITTRNSAHRPTLNRFVDFADPALMRLIGRWLGDGSIGHETHDGAEASVNFVFDASDLEGLEEVARLMATHFGLETPAEFAKGQATAHLRYTRRPLARWFAGTFGEGFAGKHLPDWAFQLPRAHKTQLLVGLFQADGCVSNDNGYIALNFDHSNRDLAEGVWRLARSLGYGPSLHGGRVRPGGTVPHYRVHISAKDAPELAIACGIDEADTRSTQSSRREIHFDDLTAYPVAKVTREPFYGTVYNLQIEEDESYVAELVVVHNCFIQAVDDDLVNEGGIMDLWTREARLFKFGAGTGSNFSKIRAENEPLTGGGKSSGVMSFLKIGDRAAGAIKSGGTTRRAAKMVILDIDHPDVETFIDWKKVEEEKVRALIAAGYPSDFNGEAYQTVSGQNSNNSVRVTEEFLKAVENDEDWDLTARTDGSVMKTVKARDLWRRIAEAAWACADPGIQYDTTINQWHTSPAGGRINASNPCFTGDTRIATDKGLVRFADLVRRAADGETFAVYSHDATNEDSPTETIRVSSPTQVMVTGTNEIVRLEFSDGRVIRCTPNHRFWTKNRGWVRADTLRGNDKVRLLDQPVDFGMASWSIPVPTDASAYQRQSSRRYAVNLPEKWGEGLAHYLGWLIGDGTFTGGRAITIYGTETEQQTAMIMHQALLAEINGGVAPKPIAQANGTMQLRVGRGAINKFVDALGVKQVPSHEKRVPWSIFEAPKPIVSAFLRGLFDADGCVSRQEKNATRYAGLGSTSQELLRDVQLLLDTFGVHGSIYSTRAAANETSFTYETVDGEQRSYSSRAMYDLRISGSHLERFAAQIGFGLSEKHDLLEQMLRETSRYRTRTWATIRKAESDGFEVTYNLTEPVNHSYLANGVLVSNCSEYLFLDNTACNLASLNLVRFYDDESQTFDIEAYKHAIRLWTVVLEISVAMAHFPSKEIAQGSYDYRTLGLGYANLGSLLMRSGIPYDSDEGRAIAGALTSILTGDAYAASAEMASVVGPFPKFEENRENMLRVMRNHRRAAYGAPDNEYEGVTHHVMGVDHELCPPELAQAAHESWDRAIELGEEHGYRNAQATCTAPTGTIGLLMDADTTGVEPDFALVKFKKLAGGGYFKIANQSIDPALRALGYTEEQRYEMVRYVVGSMSLDGSPHVNAESLREKGFTDEDIANIEATLPGVFELRHAFNVFVVGEEAMQRLGFDEDTYTSFDFDMLRALGYSKEQIEEANAYICGMQTIEGAPHLADEHLPVFDCANKNGKHGERFIHHTGHIKMMGACQPHISGAQSKTINMPNEVTITEIEEAYAMSADLGIKAMALYRDGSKASQPLSSTSGEGDTNDEEDEAVVEALESEHRVVTGTFAPGVSPTQAYHGVTRPRFLLPSKRTGWTQEARIGGHKVFLRTGEYADGTLGELFIDLAKEGATLRGILSCFAIAVSKGLQYGVPLEEFVDTFTFQTFEPRGMVEGHPNIKMANSIVDYVFRAVGLEYLGRDDLVQVKPAEHDLPEPPKGLAVDAGVQLGLDEDLPQTAPISHPAVAEPTKKPSPNGKGNGNGHKVVEKIEVKVGVRAGDTQTASVQQALGEMMGDAPLCDTCGHITVRNGSCYRCLNCGNSMGCS